MKNAARHHCLAAFIWIICLPQDLAIIQIAGLKYALFENSIDTKVAASATFAPNDAAPNTIASRPSRTEISSDRYLSDYRHNIVHSIVRRLAL